MEALTLAHRIAEIIVEKQGEDTLILDLQGLTGIADYFVLSTAGSGRQLEALQQAIREGLKKETEPLIPLSGEGTAESGWILLDYGSVIVHLFAQEMRAYYRLEELWKKARVVARIQ